MFWLKNYFFFLIVVIVVGCNKSKNIDIPLPDYKRELVVECYIEPGKPYKLLLTESVSYLDSPVVPEVQDALVTISFQGKTDTLRYNRIIPVPNDTTKYFNFISETLVPEIYNEPFVLHVEDKLGRKLKGTTRILPPAMLDTVRYVFTDEDSLGYIIAEVKDDPTITNYYRFVLLDYESPKTELIQDVYFDEQLTTNSPYLIKFNNKILIKSKNEISRFSTSGKHQILRLYHIEEGFYKYLRSVIDSKNANGNPFAQPPSIHSNVEGGIGIFTGLSIKSVILNHQNTPSILPD